MKGAGLFAMALGAWGLGAVTPDRGLWTGGRAAGSAEIVVKPTSSRSEYRGPGSAVHCSVRLYAKLLAKIRHLTKVTNMLTY